MESKRYEMIKDCPVPADEEFKRVAELWEVEDERCNYPPNISILIAGL